MPSPKATIYGDINDPEFLGYNTAAGKKWEAMAAKQAELAEAQAQWDALDPLAQRGIPKIYGPIKARLADLTSQITSLQGEAQVLETKRENRGAVLKQGGVNTQTGAAGAEAVKAENLLSQNINQELVGRIAKNTQQATEAQSSVNLLSRATIGRQAVKAGQAGYDASSGTAQAMTEAAISKSAADKAAIEGYRIGRQNLLMGQGEAATKAAESLTGSINTQTADWAAKSTAAVGDVTGTLLKNMEQLVAVPGFSGDAQTPGVKASSAAVDTTLDTWSLKSYMDVLNTLTSHSANKSTWDQMLLDQASPAANPYGQFNAAISPLTPIAGAQSNLLAAAAGAGSPDVYSSNLSGTKNNGRLI